MQDKGDNRSPDSNARAATENPQSASKERMAIGSEDGQEPPEVMLESDSSWQEGRVGEEPEQERSTFMRFRKKIQRPKGQRSNGWCLLHSSRDREGVPEQLLNSVESNHSVL